MHAWWAAAARAVAAAPAVDLSHLFSRGSWGAVDYVTATATPPGQGGQRQEVGTVGRGGAGSTNAGSMGRHTPLCVAPPGCAPVGWPPHAAAVGDHLLVPPCCTCHLPCCTSQPGGTICEPFAVLWAAPPPGGSHPPKHAGPKAWWYTHRGAAPSPHHSHLPVPRAPQPPRPRARFGGGTQPGSAMQEHSDAHTLTHTRTHPYPPAAVCCLLLPCTA